MGRGYVHNLVYLLVHFISKHLWFHQRTSASNQQIYMIYFVVLCFIEKTKTFFATGPEKKFSHFSGHSYFLEKSQKSTQTFALPSQTNVDHAHKNIFPPQKQRCFPRKVPFLSGNTHFLPSKAAKMVQS